MTISALDTYLTKHFLNAAQFAAACGISVNELDDWIEWRLIPAPSYTVTESSSVSSFVFGEMAAHGSTSGRYFHPANQVWVDLARALVGRYTAGTTHQKLKARFAQNFQAALEDLNATTWRLRDSFDDNGSPIAVGLGDRTNSTWDHFLHGTFGLCVAEPLSEAAIARKEVLQEKLVWLSDDGARSEFRSAEAQEILDLIDAFAEATMPFSPVEYNISSRKRLVEDLRAAIGSA